MISNNLSVEQIAEVVHEANRAYCRVTGDPSQPSWAEAPVWQIQSAIAGVEHHLKNPDTSPSESHTLWMLHKIKDGWTYGPEKNAELKQHPCMVPYESLPANQRMKDYLFSNIISTLQICV
jgi:hypothetical protein